MLLYTIYVYVNMLWDLEKFYINYSGISFIRFDWVNAIQFGINLLCQIGHYSTARC